MAFLCACVSPTQAEARVAAWPFRERPVAWTQFLKMATDHHVIPSVHRTLKALVKVDAVQVPTAIREALRRDFMTIAAHSLRATANLQRLQRLLAEHGIQLIPIKGPALAVLAYGSTSLRQFEDLDVIVRQEDLLRAVDLLEQDGYAVRGVPSGATRTRYLAWLQDWGLHKPGNPVHLDLKPVLISHTLCGSQSAELMAQSCRPLTLEMGGRLLAPGAEAMLLAVCIDGANEMWEKLSSVVDVGRLLTSCPAADWVRLVQTATELGQRRSLLVGVQVAAMLLECPVPEAFLAAMSRDPVAGRLAAQAARRMLTKAQIGSGRHAWFALQTRDRMRGRWRFLMRTLFVPGTFDLNAMPLSSGWSPLYSIARPIRLAWDIVGRGGKPRRLP
jgi:hypothetical protein